MYLKRNLKRLLSDRDMTAAQLGRLVGIPKTTLSEWLAGGNPRDLNKVKLVADFMKISVDELCFGDGQQKENEFTKHLDEVHAGIFEVILRKVKE